MKELKKLEGAKMLSKMEQKGVKGGLSKSCFRDGQYQECPEGYCCEYFPSSGAIICILGSDCGPLP